MDNSFQPKKLKFVVRLLAYKDWQNTPYHDTHATSKLQEWLKNIRMLSEVWKQTIGQKYYTKQ